MHTIGQGTSMADLVDGMIWKRCCICIAMMGRHRSGRERVMLQKNLWATTVGCVCVSFSYFQNGLSRPTRLVSVDWVVGRYLLRWGCQWCWCWHCCRRGSVWGGGNEMRMERKEGKIWVMRRTKSRSCPSVVVAVVLVVVMAFVRVVLCCHPV